MLVSYQVGVIGFEPTASASQRRRSTKLSYTPKRKRWDSNPRMLSHRWFSRPVPSTTRPLFLALLHCNALFLKIIQEFIVLCQDVISINRQTIICPPVSYYIFTLTMNIKTFFGVKVRMIAGVQINH